MGTTVNFNDIRPIEDSRRKGFEELCCQIARRSDAVPDAWNYARIGDPDGGIECKWESSDGEIWGWQAKYVDRINSDSLTQVDRSIEKALDTYDGLTRYYVCVPCDRPHSPDDDGRTKTALQKWNDRKEKWERWADERGMDVEFIFWGHSELVEFLSEDTHKGQLYFWFGSEQLTDEKLQRELSVTIDNAKDRYTPELHVDTGNSATFEGLGRTPTFVEHIDKLLEELNEAQRQLSDRQVEVLEEAEEESYRTLQGAVEAIPLLFAQSDRAAEQIPITELRALCDDASDAIHALRPRLHDLKKQADEEKEAAETVEKSTQYDFRQLQTAVNQVQRFCNSNELKAATTPGLKVLGEAGMGKTHLLCKIAQDRMQQGQPTVLLLGENFDNRDIWVQIIQRLGLDCTPDEFLGALDAFGEARNVRSLIMIDALNETPDARMWDRQLSGILRKIEEYPHIGLCVSCRTGYEDYVIPDTVDNRSTELRHYGFYEVEYKAVRTFFDSHGIEHQSVPVFQREFQIPLFLKLFCENLYRQDQSRVTHGPEGIDEIFEGYIDGVHARLHPELDYDPGENKVRQAVDALAYRMVERGIGIKRLPKSEAKDIINDLLPGRSFSNSLYRHLLSEGVIAEVASFDDDEDEAVRFSYDKFADHELAQQYFNIHVEDDFSDALTESDELQELFDEPQQYAGLIEALAIHLPEQDGTEIFEHTTSDEIVELYIRALQWRAPRTLTNAEGELDDDIEEYLLREMGLLDNLHDFWRVLLALATSTDHPLNAEYLFDHLIGWGLIARDFNWSQFLHSEWHSETSEVFRLVNWGFSLDHDPIESTEIKRLMAITLSLFLSCPNRYVRDRATKAIVNVVGSDLEVFGRLIERFEDVNDLYILERVYAAAYGSVLRHKQHKAVATIADRIYEIEFENNDPALHVLARDYARGIIEVANAEVPSYSVDMEKVRPPYDCSFEIDIPSPEELNEQVQAVLEDSDADSYPRFWLGLVGGDFEGRGHSDFARYVVGTNTSPNQVHGYDLSGDEALRWITKRVFDLGWSPDAFGGFDERVSSGHYGRMENKKPERFSKKYQWLAYHELVAWMTDHCEFAGGTTKREYDGPWTYYRRDIDPSVLKYEYDSELRVGELERYDFRIEETSADEWLADYEEFLDLPHLLQLKVNDEDWFPLMGVLKWRVEEPETDLEREIFCRIDTALVDTADRGELVDWLQDTWVETDVDEYKGTMFHLGTFTQVFWGEHPWHPSFRDRWEDDAQALSAAPVDTYDTTVELRWESGYDSSVPEKYGILAPSQPLAETLDLRWVVDTREFTRNSADGLQLANIPLSGDEPEKASSSTLLAAEADIVEQLEQEHLSLIWVVQGEKRVRTQDFAGNGIGLTQVRAVFYLNNDGEFIGAVESGFYE